MSSKPLPSRGGGLLGWAAGAILLAATWAVRSASAQTSPPAAPPPDPIFIGQNNQAPAQEQAGVPGDGVIQAGCNSCGSLPPPGGDYSGLPCCGCGSGGCGGNCYPGRKPGCCICNSDTLLGRMFCGIYECICCPDPCYEGRWIPAADSAFFVDAARPQTQMAFRWDEGFDLREPDRAEYFWARRGTKGTPTQGFNSVHYSDFVLSTEAAMGAFGLVVDTPYREVETNPGPPTQVVDFAGFADLDIATKAMLLDCELLQLTFQFKTFIPAGNVAKDLGTGHVSLEPALLATLKMTPDDYLQGESAYWIPIGGDPNQEGNIWHNHFSWNHVLWRANANVQVVGTLEANSWIILNGLYTVDLAPAPMSTGPGIGGNAENFIMSTGPGIRVFICDKLDLGVGSAFSITGARWAEELIRTELRLRF